MKFDTICVQGAHKPAENRNTPPVPVYLTTAFSFDSVQYSADLFDLKASGDIYTRLSNPTTSTLEARLAAIEGGVGALAVSSGQSASLLAILNIAKSGEEIVASTNMYGGTVNLLNVTLRKMGITTHFVTSDNPKDYEDNGELEGSENADSATPAQDKKGQPSKSKLSFLKNKPAELKHMFVNKISFVNKKQEHKEKTAEINPDTKESAAEKKPAAKKISDFDNKQKETIKHSSAINWSIDDDGNIKGAKKEKELSVSEILSSNVPEEQTAEVKTSDQTVTDTSLASAEPETFADPESFEETEIKEADSLLDSDIPDIISFDDESVSSPDIDNDSDMDIIDQFEQESESLTADIENSIQNREHQEEISYDIDFEDPEENSEPENIQEDLPENFFADEQEKQIKDNDATVISDATTINEGNFEDTPSEEDFQNEQDVIEEDVYEEQPADTVQEDEIVQADNVNEIRYEQTEPADNQDSKPEISIEPDAEKDKTASFNPNATSLGDIFSQMEQDARQTVEGEELSGIQENAGTATAASANSSANNSTPAEVILPPKKKKTGNYKISTDLLTEYAENQYWIIDEETKQASLNLKETLKS